MSSAARGAAGWLYRQGLVKEMEWQVRRGKKMYTSKPPSQRSIAILGPVPLDEGVGQGDAAVVEVLYKRKKVYERQRTEGLQQQALPQPAERTRCDPGDN